MEPARWEHLQEIYHQGLALPPSERDPFLVSACAGDLDLLREVKALLKAADSRGGILDSPVVELGRASDIVIGSTIGERYLVESELPHGGMSQVYLASDLRLPPQRVVIKILSPTSLENSYAQRRFDQEVEALSHMEHSGVVRVVDRGELADGRPYIVMPYVDGVSLRTQILSGGMDLERAASILKQIGAALDHVHQKGIFHRDLKPENIMLRRGTDSVVLIDFGIAKIRASLVAQSTVSEAIAGTLPYMSPEQLRGEKITAASDVYSMGVVAYEMVTGRRPFNPPSPSQLLEMQRTGIRLRPKKLREKLSTTADRAICRALKFQPRARYERAGEFGDELSNALMEEPEQKRRRNPTWAKVIAGLIVIAALSYGIYKIFGTGTGNDTKTSVVTPTPTPTPPSRTLTYFLTVQRMGSGKENQKPYTSNGQYDTFERGDKFQLNISASNPGYLYVFNEGPPEENDTSFTMVYPNNKINDGSATLGANQAVQSNWITFRGPPGNENFWIVWSILPVDQLESAKTEALKHPRGGLTGQNLVSLKEFLQMKQRESDTKVRHYKADQRAVASGKSDLLITFAQFKHR